MNISYLRIRNFKSIRDLEINDIQQALILVGKNSTGKTVVLDAIRAACGYYEIEEDDFREDHANIMISISMSLTEEDLKWLHEQGKVSRFRKWDAWYKDFQKKLPSFQQGVLTFTYVANWKGDIFYQDGVHKHNSCITDVLPTVHYIDTQRNLEDFQQGIMELMEDKLITKIRNDCCIFDSVKPCKLCFECMGIIQKKKANELDAFETARLLDYKLYQLNMNNFSARVNENFRANGGQELIRYTMNCDRGAMLTMSAEVADANEEGRYKPVTKMAKGMRSVYMLSLLETYAQSTDKSNSLIIVEEPEIFLHPELQNVAGDILYRLSRKNQVLFSTHSANLLQNFNSKQIRQMILDANGSMVVKEETNISRILDDLGYSAADFMNVDFVFIVEGKQDKSRLPLLIRKYYQETVDQEGKMSRIAIITTNSCTNIKTYANLKYMNQSYMKDRFMMIRDGDGKDHDELQNQLCHYYNERKKQDDAVPRIKPENVLILHYYSFENYFLDPAVMAEIGVIPDEAYFYTTFLEKWKEYLNRIKSGEHLKKVIGCDIETVEDVRQYIEEIRIYMRGHNLYDIFYGPFKKKEEEILTKYIEKAPRSVFANILDAIDQFIYFESRKK